MFTGLPNVETADTEEGWDDFSPAQNGNVSHQQETAFAISSPSISTSAFFQVSDHENDMSHETPLQRLLKVVNVMSQKALSASVAAIGSTVCMTDRIASSAPLNKSKAAIGDDLAATAASCLRKRCFSRCGGTIGSRKTRQCMNANMYNSSGQLMDWENFDENSTFTCMKRPRMKMLPVKQALLEEIRKINEQLIDTVVSICDNDTMTTETAATIGREGITVECSFVAMANGPDLLTQQASPLQLAVHPLKLLVPKSYPRCSPIFKKLHVESWCDECPFPILYSKYACMIIFRLCRSLVQGNGKVQHVSPKPSTSVLCK